MYFAQINRLNVDFICHGNTYTIENRKCTLLGALCMLASVGNPAGCLPAVPIFLSFPCFPLIVSLVALHFPLSFLPFILAISGRKIVKMKRLQVQIIVNTF